MELLLNNKSFSYEQIKAGEYVSASPFEERTLLFCQQWLNGQQEFEQKTSGSTGKPKPIKITRAQMVVSAKQTVDALNLASDDVALVCIDTAFIGGKMMLVRAFEHQMKIIIIEPSSNPLENIETPFHFAAMVPLQFENTIKSNLEKLANCKAIIIGGAPVSESLASKILSLKVPVFSTYGMTETSSHIALKRLSLPAEDHYTTLGDVTIKINSNEQLLIKGTITNNVELITSDRVRILSSTTFKWLGRIDNVVNSGGLKIQLEEIESQIEHLFKINGIKNRFFLIGEPDAYLGEKLILCLEGKNSTIQTNIANLLETHLEKFSRPKEILFIINFTESTSGKIKRKESYQNRLN